MQDSLTSHSLLAYKTKDLLTSQQQLEQTKQHYKHSKKQWLVQANAKEYRKPTATKACPG
jgi:hypothetical protein